MASVDASTSAAKPSDSALQRKPGDPLAAKSSGAQNRASSPAPRSTANAADPRGSGTARTGPAALFMGFFSFVRDEDINRLRHHKFSSAGYTMLDNLMDPFWLAIAKKIPRCISPNLISCIGGFFAAIASLSSVIATRFESRFLYFVAPFFIFIYMTGDAVDGKHARLTGQSSPLGALVDHGIDAFIAFTTGVSVCVTVDPALSTPRLMLAYCLFHCSWFCAQWGELELGALDQRGITEGEFLTMFALSLPGLISLDIMSWSSPVLPFLGSMQLRHVYEYGVIIGCGAVSLGFTFKILASATGRRFQASVPILHMCVHSVVSVMFSSTPLAQQSTLLSFLVVGMNAATLMTKIRLAATFHCIWPGVHLELLPFFVLAGLQIIGFELGIAMMFVVLAWQCIAFVLLWHDTISRICKALDIPFLAEVPQKQN